MDSPTLLALVLLAVFVIDRASHALVYGVSLTGLLRRSSARAPDLTSTESKKTTVLYFCISSVLSILFLVCWGPLPILSGLPTGKLGKPATDLLEELFTFIVLVGGADRISALLDSSQKLSSPIARTADTLVLTGEVRVEEGRKV